MRALLSDLDDLGNQPALAGEGVGDQAAMFGFLEQRRARAASVPAGTCSATWETKRA
jgi:hypothetical protein